MPEALTFTCSICGEPSESICVYCTKDSCPNHLCDRCFRCSDCCECNLRRQETASQNGTLPTAHAPVSSAPDAAPAAKREATDSSLEAPDVFQGPFE